jgi:hypothetical protein
MLNDPVANAHWDRLFSSFSASQLCLFAPDGELVAGCNSAPLPWDGTDDGLPEGWDDQLLRSVEAADEGTAPDTLAPSRSSSARTARGPATAA